MGDVNSLDIFVDQFFSFKQKSPDFFNNLIGPGCTEIPQLCESLSKWKTLSAEEKDQQHKEYLAIFNKIIVTLANDDNLEGLYGYTALIAAAGSGATEIVKLLIDNGANINKPKRFGEVIIPGQRLKKTERNIEYWSNELHARTKNQENDTGNTPLMEAVTKGHTETVKFLLVNGANATIMNNDGRLPFTEAVARGHIDIVKLMLEMGADVNMTDSKGSSALMLAVERQYLFSNLREKFINLAELLLANGAIDVDSKALKYAEEQGPNPVMLKQLRANEQKKHESDVSEINAAIQNIISHYDTKKTGWRFKSIRNAQIEALKYAATLTNPNEKMAIVHAVYNSIEADMSRSYNFLGKNRLKNLMDTCIIDRTKDSQRLDNYSAVKVKENVINKNVCIKLSENLSSNKNLNNSAIQKVTTAFMKMLPNQNQKVQNHKKTFSNWFSKNK